MCLLQAVRGAPVQLPSACCTGAAPTMLRLQAVAHANCPLVHVAPSDMCMCVHQVMDVLS